LYPGVDAAEKEKAKAYCKGYPAAPDMVNTAAGIAPNYDAFPGWTCESVLAFCNID
jgi:hypothetical protein